MAYRRVVCGNVNGKAEVLSDGPAPTEHDFTYLPGHRAAIMWATSRGGVTLPGSAETAPLGTTAMPQAGETRFLVVHFPPASVMFGPGFDPEKAEAEQRTQLPGLVEHFEPDNPGMHRTNSIDYDIVLDGTIWLELDDGKEVELKAGDIAIQQGTRHAWRTKGDVGATMAFVLMGAEGH